MKVIALVLSLNTAMCFSMARVIELAIHQVANRSPQQVAFF